MWSPGILEAPPSLATMDGTPTREEMRTQFVPLFADTGGIDSWLGLDTPDEVFERLALIDETPLSRVQLNQLLVLSHEAGVSDGFFQYYLTQSLMSPDSCFIAAGGQPLSYFSLTIRWGKACRRKSSATPASNQNAKPIPMLLQARCEQAAFPAGGTRG